jgi:hypothetical protein
MALCRCKNHPPANNRRYIYNHYVEPVGYPDTSSVCGRAGCENAGFIFLTDVEFQAFQNGEDVFTYANSNVTKVRVINPNT